MFTASDHHLQMLQYYPPHDDQLEPSSMANANAIMERKWKPNVEIAPNCPRCASANTKFCYYNNYSLSQPRYFCKGCRRYWTKGGSLRNVPVGGGCRKNRRAKSAATRVSENYNKSTLNGLAIASCSFDDHSAGSNNNGGSDIDLAVVFAKFLNESSSSSSHETTELANSTSNSATPDNMIGDGNLNILEEFPQVFLEDDMNEYGLQALLSDDQDALWSEQAEAETFPDFTWHPMFQPQDFDSFPADNAQLKTSAKLSGDNWGSFDLSGFEVYDYSRP